MNHVYRSLWSQALNTWIAVAETCKGKSKNTCKNNRLITKNPLKDWQSCVFATGLLLCALDVGALPTGDQLVAGQATVNTPNAGHMQINQTSPQAIINWQGFSIAPNERVTINQPSINAVLLNRVIGADASLIQGQLSANGQVFLINPNGVLFSNTAQVDVGSLIASTHTISNVDFLSGNYHFTQNNNEGLLINQGVIKVPAGGVVALIGSQVSNQGTIESPKGTTALAAGKTVDLDFQGDGLLAVNVSEAALKAQIENKGAILADGGRVVLTAKAAGDLVDTVINQAGIVRAQGLVERNGEIILDGGDKGVTQISGKLDVSGQHAGGKINVTGKDVELAANANLVAQALESGKAGTIAVFGDMKNGSVNVAGTLDASAPKTGDGGFIETSAAHVNIADSAQITTKAASGKTGTWLVDPFDFIIATSGGDISNLSLSTMLNANSITISTATGTNTATELYTSRSGNGDIFVNNSVFWTTPNTLSLLAERNININATINGGSTGNIVLNATTGAVSESTVTLQGNSLTANAATGIALNNANAVSNFNATNTTSGEISFTNTAANLNVTGINHAGTGNVNITNSGNIDVSGAVQTANGNFTVSAGTATAGTLNATGAVSVNGIFTLNTGTWNQVASSLPSFSANDFRLNSGGTFIRALGGDGTSAAPYQIGDVYGLQGMTSSTLLTKSYSLSADINASGTSAWNTGVGFVPIGNGGSKFTGSFDGLGHTISGLTINISNSTQNVGLFGGAGDTTGINSSSISNLGLINSVITGKINTGALAGVNYGTISNTYTTGTVTGSSDKTGGLAGINHGSISKSYSTASVTGLTNVGGLVGYNTDSSSSISNSYTTATVTGNSQIGGLVGNNQNGGNISNSYTAGSVSGINFIGGLVGLNDTSSTISNAYSTSNVNGTGSSTGGLVGSNGAIINNSYATGSVVGNTAVGGLIGSTSAGTVTNAFWDTQTTGQSTSAGGTGKTTAQMKQLATFTAAGWNINDTGGSTATWRIYEGNTYPLLRSFLTPLTVTSDSVSRPYNGLAETALTNPSFSVTTTANLLGTTAPYGTAKDVGVYNAAGLYSNQQGFDITQTSGSLTITPYILNLTGTRVYDGTTAIAASTVTLGTLPNNETLTLTGSGSISNKNVGTDKPLLTPFSLTNGTGLASNYTFTGGTQKVSITPAALTINAVTDTKTYDGTTTSTQIPTFSGLQTGDTLTGLSQAFASPNVLGSNASTLQVNSGYTLSDGNAGGNYTVITNTALGTISAAALNAINLNGSRTYDGTANVAASIFSLSGLLNNDDLTLSGTGTIASKNVGTYNNIVLGTLALGNGTVGLASNYTLAGGTHTVNITPAALTINAVIDAKTYDGTTTSTQIPTFNGLQTGDTLTGLSQAFASPNALGTNASTLNVNSGYTLSDGNAGGNYTVITNSALGTISAAALNAINLSGSRTYDGTANVAANIFTLSGLVNNDDLTLSGEGTIASKNVGTYNSIVLGTLALGNGTIGLASNYTLVGGTQIVKITPATLTLNAVTDTKTYDGTTTSTAVPTFTGLQTGDTLTSLSQTFASPTVLGVNGSTLAINTGYLLNDGNAGGNYTVITNNALGTISAAALNAINLSGSRIYDGTTNVAANIFSLSGLLNNDDLTLSGVATIASKNVGTYNSINLGTLALGNGTIGLATNYTLVGGTHSVTITPAVLSLNAVTDSKVYDGSTNSTVIPTFSGLQIGDTLTNLSQAFTNKNVLGVNASTLKVNSNYALNDGNAGSNYTISSSTAVGTIAPATLTYTALPSQRVYGDANPVLNGTVTGFVNGETLANATTGSANFTSVANNTSNVNSYAIEGSGLTANFGNYNFTQAASNAIALSVTPATLVYTAIPVSSTNGANPVFTGIVTGFVNNDSLASATVGTAVFTSEVNTAGNNKKAGSFAINGSGLSAKNGNYHFVQAPSNANALTIPTPPPVEEKNSNFSGLQEQITQLEAKTAGKPSSIVNTLQTGQESNQSDNHDLVLDQTDNFAGYSSEDLPSNLIDFPCVSGKDTCNSPVILPTLKIKNSAGRVERLQLTANKRFLSLLLEDGTVRVWDFDSGVQRNILSANQKQTLTDISTVNDKGEFLAVSSHSGVGVHEVVSAIADNAQAIHKPDIHHLATSEDGRLLLIDAGSGELSLWDNQQNKPHWQLPYRRGVVAGLALNNNNQYGAVLSHHPRTYALPVSLKLKNITDAIDIIDLSTGKISKVLPNVGEQVVTMQFKDSNTLQVGLANGEIFDWSIATGDKKRVAAFAENITTVDIAGDNYAYILSDGTVRVSDSKGHIQLSTQNKDNPFKFAKLLAGGKKLLTVLASGDLSLWDVDSGKKMLRLFSTKQGWTVMDAFGRFDGSEEAIEDFSWLANEDDIPLDSFSENYYEPGLLASVLHEQHYFNSQQRAIKDGITLPPKVNLQLAEQQTETDKVALQLDVYDRGGGINKINFYHNGKLLGNEHALVTQETADHRVLALNITPNAGKNTLKVTVSNNLGIENSSAELSFDGKTKAYASTLRLLTVGIDRYSDAKLNLDYSVADANAINQVLKKNAKVAMNKSLTNEKATKARILAELKELSRGEQHDVLAVYLAGHGMVLGKEWYFLPFETKLYNDLEKIAASGITATELSEVFKNSKIQHILLMADSCHSGASVDAFSQLQNGQRYFTRQLSRSLGITVVTATTKDQEATELQSLGHGLFTYLMTQELEKKQTGTAVTAHSIAASIAKTLPAFSKKVLGISQDPAVYTHGNDFMLTEGGKKFGSDKVSSVLAIEKPKQ